MMRKKFAYLVLLFAFYVQNAMLYSQQESHISPMADRFLQNKIFDFSGKKNMQNDILHFQQLPDEKWRIQFDEDSSIYSIDIMSKLKRLLDAQFVPDMKFIKENTRFYTVTENARIETPDWTLSKVYDVVYIPYVARDWQIIVVITGDQICGATYLYVKKTADDKLRQNTLIAIKPLLHQDALKLVRIVKESDVSVERDTIFPEPSIPIFVGNDCFCIVRANYFSNEGFPSKGIFFSDWFSHHKSWDNISKENTKKRIVINKLMAERKEKCRTLIQTEQGRSELIRLIGSEEDKEKFAIVRSLYREFRELPYTDLYRFYVHYGSEKSQNSLVPFWRDEILTPVEIAELRKLLWSKDVGIRKKAMGLINVTNAGNLVPDLLRLTTEIENEQITNDRSYPDTPVTDQKFKPRVYNFSVYFLLGKLGDRRTLKSLEQLHQSDKLAKEVQADIELAIEDIKQNLAERDRQRQNWFNLRRDVREKKIFVTGGASMIDIDKPDPEPVSVDGYRNWSTTDGLFKTNAKFVALIDVTNDDGKIIDRDVQLLRKDGKKVAIELSGLCSTDREYVRQQLEPLRDWATLDGSLKIKAKLLGKFDTEIILEESDGITTLVQIENLTDKDKEYLKQKTLSPHSKYAF